MRLLPKSRRGRVAVAAGLTALLALGWCEWYRPWEAHYLGRPTSWWAADIRGWAFNPKGRPPSDRGHSVERFCRPPWAPAVWLAWLTKDLALARYDYVLPLVEGDPAAVPVLADLLRYPDARVRLAALVGLYCAEDASRPAVPAVLAVLEDPDRQVRDHARWTLELLDPEALAAHDRDRRAMREGGE